jgi:hypothetical protein
MSGVRKDQLEKRRSDIISAIKELGGVATPAQVAELLGNIKGENVRKCMGRMAEDGILVRVGHGLYRVAGSGILEGKDGGSSGLVKGVLVEDVLERKGKCLGVSEKDGGDGGVKSGSGNIGVRELVVKALLGEVKSVCVLYVKYSFWKWLGSICIMCPDMKVMSKVKMLIGESYKMLTPSQLRGFVSVIAETKGNKTVGEVLDEAFIGWEEISI